jgi:hypothetical protein
MQYFGTEVCRNNLDDDIWIRNTIDRAKAISFSTGLLLIPDVRFPNESDAILAIEDYTVIVLHIKTNKQGLDSHSSESNKFEYTNSVENDGSLLNLFYKVLLFVQNLIRK